MTYLKLSKQKTCPKGKQVSDKLSLSHRKMILASCKKPVSGLKIQVFTPVTKQKTKKLTKKGMAMHIHYLYFFAIYIQNS